jgi:[ribosomal protein S18]-alanine N-acetyltransferase
MPTRFSIRPFRSSDMPAILKIEHASFRKDAYDRNLFAEFYHKCGDLFLVAEGTGRIWGYMVTCTRSRGPSRMAQLISVAVAPEARHRGVASALMDSTLRRLRRRGVGRFSLMVKVTNRRALAFYRKYGFLQLRVLRKYYEDGKDAWLMVRDLP